MKNICVMPNIHKDKNLRTTRSLVEWIIQHGYTPILNEIVAQKIGFSEYGKSGTEIFEKSDFIVALGGDGTILNVARQCASFSTPILGVNLGHLGFLAEVDAENVVEAVEKIVNNEFFIDKRMMLEASIIKENMEAVNLIALNDIVVTRGSFSRMVKLKVFVNEQYVNTYLADGIIISSPTGSTAYSLSAGGPIVYPNLELFVITPICPHTLHSRSIIVSEKDKVKLVIVGENQDVMVTTDGQQGYKLNSGDTIYVKKSNRYTNLIRLKSMNFFELLRSKLSERNFNI
ncbi:MULTISPECIES: NAD(+)/NADH kinase [unclassified Thermoanaerobacterium]|uniref:NAD(+)/NADH kinase n=1 Tax=unclassified Thermoanaerobacterium TaxID=2622527 RepID=UPI000A150FDD|nr:MULTISPECIES: NAD(+)/NADH kinase [unclassified Thermoanaerobacterium]MDE4541705.1 NAD(+)/NADH kinase [Thermoanaerobacterium sp. R66]ORX24114.1 NAD(+) kinase [Thermoanaerobacterium sp. PSU-2]HHV73726.1 NAD(+)/NADH kinase [Thermoanaerobacterium sp.]